MKKKIVYTDEPIGDVEVIEDFLPPPENLIFKEDNVKVTISLSHSSIEFFKRAAKKNKTQYQKLIRRVLDLYASWYEHEGAGEATRRARQQGAALAREKKTRRGK